MASDEMKKKSLIESSELGREKLTRCLDEIMRFVDDTADNYDADANHNSNGDDNILQLHQHSEACSYNLYISHKEM